MSADSRSRLSADRPPRVEIMTGLARDHVDDLVLQLHERGVWAIRRRRALDPHRSVVVVLLYLRHNLSQDLLVPERRTGPDPLGIPAREFDKMVASQRACVERAIAHMRHWKILATGYRRLLSNFPAALDVITKLEIYRTST